MVWSLDVENCTLSRRTIDWKADADIGSFNQELSAVDAKMVTGQRELDRANVALLAALREKSDREFELLQLKSRIDGIRQTNQAVMVELAPLQAQLRVLSDTASQEGDAVTAKTVEIAQKIQVTLKLTGLLCLDYNQYLPIQNIKTTFHSGQVRFHQGHISKGGA